MEAEAIPRRSMVGVAILCEGGLGVVALALGWFLPQQPLAQIAWTVTALGQGLLAAVPMLIALWAMTRWPVGPLRSLDELVRRLVVPMFRDCTSLDLLLISTAAGFGEELLFRGVLQAGTQHFTGSVWLAIALAGAVFGLAHPISKTYAVLAGLIGIYLGWLLVATDNLLVPIVAHAAYDFVALVYLLRTVEEDPAPDSADGQQQDLTMAD